MSSRADAFMNKNQEKKSSLLLVLSVVFLDLLGFGIALPIIAPLFLTTDILGSVPHEAKNFLLGLLLASYAFAQFLGSPILGALSDRFGRKPVLVSTMIGNGLGYLLFALGIYISNVPLLFFSRILAGFTGGNISVAQSIISDISTPQEKTKNFGLMGMAFGLGFVLGPFMGGILSDNTFVSWFSLATPFLFAFLLSMINIFYVTFTLHETHHSRIHKKISLLTGMRNLRAAFSMANLRSMFLVMFIFTMGFSFFTQFFQVFLIDKFGFTSRDIGHIFGFMGLCIALTQGLITRFVAKRVSSHSVLRVTYFGVAIAIAAMLIPSQAHYLYVVIACMAIFNGLTMANSTAVVSNMADKESQGEVLGISQSLQALGMAIPPVIAGIVASLWVGLPIAIGSFCVLVAGIIFATFVHKSVRKFHEE